MSCVKQSKCCWCLFPIKYGIYAAIFLCIAGEVLFVVNLGFWNVIWIVFCAVLIAGGVLNLVLIYFVIKPTVKIIRWIAIGDCIMTFVNFGLSGAVAGLIFISYLNADLRNQATSDCISYTVVRNIVTNNILRLNGTTFDDFINNGGVSIYSVYLVSSSVIFSILFAIGTVNVWLYYFYIDSKLNSKDFQNEVKKEMSANPYEFNENAAAIAAAAAAGYDVSLLQRAGTGLGQMPVCGVDRASLALSQRSYVMSPVSPLGGPYQNFVGYNALNSFTGSVPVSNAPQGIANQPLPGYANLNNY